LNKRDIVLIVLVIAITAVVAITVVQFAPVVAPPQSITARLWSVANSAIFIAVVSTFLAAFAGTWGAQLLAERVARRKELIAEIRGTNAAIGLAFNIANTYITTKKQLVRDLVTQFERQSAEWQAHCSGIGTGTIPPLTPFIHRIELKPFSTPFSPVEELQTTLRDRISPDGKALILLTPLAQSIHGFAYTVEQRNEWIKEYMRLPPGDDAYRANLYFGTPYAPRRTDDRYPNFIKALGGQTDDCIAFSILIAESLKRYGNRLAAQYGRGAPKISEPDFGRAGDLLPDMRRYSNWVQG
jgi:hypothetical protein